MEPKNPSKALQIVPKRTDKPLYEGPAAVPVEKLRGEDVAQLPDTGSVEFQGETEGQPLKDAQEVVAINLVDLLAKGLPMAQAAQEVGPQGILGLRGAEGQRKLAEVLKRYGGLTALELKELVKAKAIEKVFEGEDDRIQLQALNLIAGMPEVGLTPSAAKTVVQVQQNVLSPETAEVLSRMEKIEEK